MQQMTCQSGCDDSSRRNELDIPLEKELRMARAAKHEHTWGPSLAPQDTLLKIQMRPKLRWDAGAPSTVVESSITYKWLRIKSHIPTVSLTHRPARKSLSAEQRWAMQPGATEPTVVRDGER